MEGNSRRDFLKKAGVAAWTVPAVQVVNMTGAFAGSPNTSVTTTTVPPTTKPPCEKVKYHLKAVLSDQDGGGFSWASEGGPDDCITDYTTINPGDLIIKVVFGDGYVAVVHEIPYCTIVAAAAKSGRVQPDDGGAACVKGALSKDGSYAKWEGEPGEGRLYELEVVVECCID